ncbi:MAG: dethiobiotin synthase [Cyclobacteriaceae bacterium]|nr:dethiobiotin synthase [Cyclobacteriaceae bacterium]
MKIFITAIGTDSGKTLVSSILVEYFKADYWKPIQCGLPRDTDGVRSLISNNKSVFHDEKWLLKTPASPHFAAEVEGIDIELNDFKIPETSNHLIIEGAGGLLVPINNKECVIDLATHFKCPVILVANLYLGSINHTLLSLEYLKSKDISVLGVIFNGESNKSSEKIIEMKSPFPILAKIPHLDRIDKQSVKKIANNLKITLNE